MSDNGNLDWLDRECKRIQIWNAAHPIVKIGRTPPYVFTMAELRKWTVDRSSGFLRIIWNKPKKPTLAEYRKALAMTLPHLPPEIRARIERLAA